MKELTSLYLMGNKTNRCLFSLRRGSSSSGSVVSIVFKSFLGLSVLTFWKDEVMFFAAVMSSTLRFDMALTA